MKHTILFLAANPRDTDQLALQQECAEIERELRMATGRDHFDFHSRWAVSVDDLMRHLNELSPSVLHFSGHGTRGGSGAQAASGAPRRDIESPRGAGILLHDGDDSQYVGERALAMMITSASPSTRLVVLNACHSAAIADTLRHAVDCVVGLDGAIDDAVARRFAVAFYRAVGHRRSIGNAVAQAAAVLHAKQQPDPLLTCVTRDGFDADHLFLVAPDRVEAEQSRSGRPEAHTRTSPSRTPQPTTAQPSTPPERREPTADLARSSIVDIGILTTRDDEFRAVLRAFPGGPAIHKGRRREYALRDADAGHGERYRVAVLRMIEQGNGEAQAAAMDLVADLAPRLVLVVGIAGGLPSDDVQLGDVIVATRVHDFSVTAHESGSPTAYAAGGGPIDSALAAAVAILPAREDDLGDWTAELPPPPSVTRSAAGQLYGPPAWQGELRAWLKKHDGSDAAPRRPIYAAGPIASSHGLMKDPEPLIPWLQTARNLLAVEMESGGVYIALRERCPMLAIRGISNIVGLRREEAWTTFACASAAAFARAFLRTRPIERRDPITRRGPEPVLTGGSQPDPTRSQGANAAADHDLFVAHPSANRSSARALYDLLQSDIRVFLAERSLQTSEQWDEEVLAAQRASWATVLMISPQCDAAWYLGDEVITAIELHRASPDAHRLVLVLLEPGISVPYTMSQVPAIDATTEGDLAGVAARLREQVAAWCQAIPPVPPRHSRVASGRDSSPERGVRARRDHVGLYDRLARLSDTLFQQIVSDAEVQRETRAPPTAPLAGRVLEVAQLAALDPVLGRRLSLALDRRALWTRA